VAIPFNRRSAKSILRYAEGFSALVSLWILTGVDYENLPASANVVTIQGCAIFYFMAAYIFDVFNFQSKYWEIWPILELSIDLLFCIIMVASGINLVIKCTKNLEGIPYCSDRGGILDSWLQPNAAAVTTVLTGFSCGQSTLVDIGRLRKGDFYNY